MNKVNDFVYLATPYTDDDEKVEQERFIKVTEVAGRLMKQGYIVYSPITHNHPIAAISDLPKSWEYWKKVDETFLLRSVRLLILKLDGWNESKGVAAEIQIAKDNMIPYSFISESDVFTSNENKY